VFLSGDSGPLPGAADDKFTGRALVTGAASGGALRLFCACPAGTSAHVTIESITEPTNTKRFMGLHSWGMAQNLNMI
jgi:hypothetical protein